MDFQKNLADLDAYLAQFPLTLKAREVTGVRQSVLLIGAIAATSILVLVNSGADPLVNLVGFIYPIYASFKALKSTTKVDDTEWLIYWIVYGFFVLIEDFIDAVFDEETLGLVYYFAKLVFLVWLYLPQTKGANQVFARLIFPFLSRYEGRIDAKLFGAASLGNQAYGEMKSDVAGGTNKGAMLFQQAYGVAKVMANDRGGLFAAAPEQPAQSGNSVPAEQKSKPAEQKSVPAPAEQKSVTEPKSSVAAEPKSSPALKAGPVADKAGKSSDPMWESPRPFTPVLGATPSTTLPSTGPTLFNTAAPPSSSISSTSSLASMELPVSMKAPGP